MQFGRMFTKNTAVCVVADRRTKDEAKQRTEEQVCQKKKGVVHRIWSMPRVYGERCESKQILY